MRTHLELLVIQSSLAFPACPAFRILEQPGVTHTKGIFLQYMSEL